MTETEQLQENARKSLVESRYKELNEYMDSLHIRMEAHFKEMKQTLYLMVATWIVWMAVGFLDNLPLHLAAFSLYFASFLFMQWRERKMQKTAGELRGALKVMRILGMIDFDWDSIGSKKKRKILSEYADMVKGWFTEKKKAQDKVYSPA